MELSIRDMNDYDHQNTVIIAYPAIHQKKIRGHDFNENVSPGKECDEFSPMDGREIVTYIERSLLHWTKLLLS
jgi:hypothetical protein